MTTFASAASGAGTLTERIATSGSRRLRPSDNRPKNARRYSTAKLKDHTADCARHLGSLYESG